MNDKPYYSADNGFACAAASRGITEALREHLNIIARDESLATEIDQAQISAEIDVLYEGIQRLDQEKVNRLGKIRELTDVLAKKDIKLAELKTGLNAPVDTDTPPLSDDHIQSLTNEIDEKTTQLEIQKVKKAELETDLKNPTEIELNPSVQSGSQQRFIFPIIATVFLIGLVFYVFVFYGSAGEKAFTAADADTQNLNEIINPAAFSKALWQSPNLLILTFPVIFIMFAIAIHPYLEKILSGELRGADKAIFIGLLIAVFAFDSVIAMRISQNMLKGRKNEAREDLNHYRNTGQMDTTEAEKAQEVMNKKWEIWTWETGLDVLSVLCAGFLVALLLGLGLYYVLKMWKSTRESDQYEKQIRSEKNDRLVQHAAVLTEIQSLGDRIGDLRKEKQAYEIQFQNTSTEQLAGRTATYKHPIEVEIARLETEKGNLQSQIKEANEQVESLQREINDCETEIDTLSKSTSKQLIDIKKLEAYANEFVSGWIRYVTQQKTELSDDLLIQIENIQDLKTEILKALKASLATN